MKKLFYMLLATMVLCPITSKAEITGTNVHPIVMGPKSHLVKKTLRLERFTKLYEQGWASYYGNEFRGHRTASGTRFNPLALTAAHRHLPFGTFVRVVNKNNGKSVIVKITDRGPASYTGRIIDLSLGAKTALGMGGVAYVRLYLRR